MPWFAHSHTHKPQTPRPPAPPPTRDSRGAAVQLKPPQPKRHALARPRATPPFGTAGSSGARRAALSERRHAALAFPSGAQQSPSAAQCAAPPPPRRACHRRPSERAPAQDGSEKVRRRFTPLRFGAARRGACRPPPRAPRQETGSRRHTCRKVQRRFRDGSGGGAEEVRGGVPLRQRHRADPLPPVDEQVHPKVVHQAGEGEGGACGKDREGCREVAEKVPPGRRGRGRCLQEGSEKVAEKVRRKCRRGGGRCRKALREGAETVQKVQRTFHRAGESGGACRKASRSSAGEGEGSGGRLSTFHRAGEGEWRCLSAPRRRRAAPPRVTARSPARTDYALKDG